MTHNLRLLPTFVKSSRGTPHLLKIGLAGNVGVAALASMLCAWALSVPGSPDPPASSHLLTLLFASVCIGFAAARLATDEVDKRLLHRAVCNASAAPAAPPDTVRAIETANASVVYTTTTDLTPPSLAAWRLGL